MTRLITIVLIGFVLLLGYLGNDVAIDAPSPAQTESISRVNADAEASSTGIDLQDLEAIPVATLAAKLDARVAAKEAIQVVLNERQDLAIGDELTIQGLRIKITRVPSKDPVVTSLFSMSVVRRRDPDSLEADLGLTWVQHNRHFLDPANKIIRQAYYVAHKLDL